MESARLSHRGPDFTARGMMPRTFADAPLIRATLWRVVSNRRFPSSAMMSLQGHKQPADDVRGDGSFPRKRPLMGGPAARRRLATGPMGLPVSIRYVEAAALTGGPGVTPTPDVLERGPPPLGRSRRPHCACR